MNSSERRSYQTSTQSEKLSTISNKHSDEPPLAGSEPQHHSYSHSESVSHHSHSHSESSRRGGNLTPDGHPLEYYERKRVRIKRRGAFFKDLFSNPLFCYIFGVVLTGVLVALFILFLYLGNTISA